MARLSKEAYEGKAAFAGRRMEENAQNKKLNAEQHEVLSEICRMRHELHTSYAHIFNGEESHISAFLCDWVGEAKTAGLPTRGFKAPNPEDIIFIEDFYLFKAAWFKKEEGEEESDGIEHCREAAYAQYGKFNEQIEDFLRKIDKRFGTDYCPSGASRIM